MIYTIRRRNSFNNSPNSVLPFKGFSENGKHDPKQSHSQHFHVLALLNSQSFPVRFDSWRI